MSNAVTATTREIFQPLRATRTHENDQSGNEQFSNSRQHSKR